ncbi:DUF1398 family protein [Deefgea rivuli]|uniref:DUF1398 family protein n=1 Tax=Deefgea rivuli TaxID=400948 RepID=UPI000485C56E|nr:DUF1398 family protein [Deefgea rivuli]
MQLSTQQIIEQCAAASMDGSAYFPDIVKALIGVGVEAYCVDYRANTTTYYLENSDTHAIALAAPNTTIPKEFDISALQQAIKGAQSGKVKYPEFLALSRAAGCVAYTVWLAGQHVSYYGRLGQTHVEHFPA